MWFRARPIFVSIPWFRWWRSTCVVWPSVAWSSSGTYWQQAPLNSQKLQLNLLQAVLNPPPPSTSKSVIMKSLHVSVLACRSLLQPWPGDSVDRAVSDYFVFISRAMEISPITSPSQEILASDFTGYVLHRKEEFPLQNGWQNGGLAFLTYVLPGRTYVSKNINIQKYPSPFCPRKKP